jgi:chorismate-pyruvate lyase
MDDKSLLLGLSHFQKVLLVTDGTVTELLEQYLDERIKVLKLYEQVEEPITMNDYGMPILRRKILLQGQHSLHNWLYAESVILLNNLSEEFRIDLLNSREPIGKLWSKYRLETYKERLIIEREQMNMLAIYFDLHAEEEMMSRTYNVYSNHKLIMVITEKFPCCFFTD